MTDIRTMSIKTMLTLVALKEADFAPHNAAYAIGGAPSNIHGKIKAIQSYFDYPIFTKGYRKWCGDKEVENGLTDKGEELYQTILLFLRSLDCMGYFDNFNQGHFKL